MDKLLKMVDEFPYLKQEIISLREEFHRIKEDQMIREWYYMDQLPMSKPKAYELEKKGKLRITRRDGRSMVLREDLMKYLQGK